MNKTSTFLKLSVMALLCLAQSLHINAQTTLISPTGDGGFENGASFAANGWTAVNGATNNWFVGAISTPSAGANAAYVSNDVAGATYTYTNTIANTVHFYRDVTFPAGETNIVLTFKWKAQGESSWDYVTVYSMPTSNTPTVNNPAGAFQSWLQIPVVYPGAVVHSTPQNLNLQGTYQTVTICLPASYAGTTRRIVFMWSNDSSGGAQPPGSVDEISLISSLTPVAPANSPTALVLTPVSVSQIDGSFTAAAGAPDGYLTVRYPAGSMPSNPVNGTTYATGAILGLGTVVSSSALTTFSATGLTPSTSYDFYVYSYTSAPCASGPLYKATAPLTGTAATLNCPSLAAGTYTVGPTGNYLSLTDVNVALANGTAGPVIFELQPTYLSTVETFPITFLGTPCPYVGGITIRPQAGAVGLSITSANATGTISINGASNITFDGRAGGVGLSQLTIENTAVTGYALQFINSARSNTLKFCTVKGVNTGTASGVIVFSTAVGLPFGNSNNTIDNCDIRDGATTPNNLIWNAGTITSYNAQNNNITISNCLIHDWFNATATTSSAAINLSVGGSDWTITNNSFYQTVARTFTMTTATEQGAIFINSGNLTPAFSVNFTITGNFIGGSAALCAGAPYTWTGGAITPRMIRFTSSIGAFSNISSNTIANLAFTTSSVATSQSLISHVNGNVNINANTIGSQSTTGNIVFTLTAASTAPFFVPISTGTGVSVSMINITNNNLGGMLVNTTAAAGTSGVSFRVIYSQAPALSKIFINNNIVGGTVANSIEQQTGTATAQIGLLAGILVLNPTVDDIITNNTVRNLTQNNTFAGGFVSGINIQASGGRHTVTGNTIFNLTTNGTTVAINNLASVVGLNMTGTAIGGSNISNNTIYNLTNTNTTVAGFIQGMYFSTPLFPQQNTIISRNFIHSINLASATGGMAGINLPNTGNARVFNNMVRLGVDAGGAPITTSVQINGILKASTGSMSIFGNSVFVGGTGVASNAVNTFAFRRTASPLAGNDTIMNNIFYNARSNASGTGKHYATGLNAGTTLASDFNDLYVDGVGGVLGLFVAADAATLAAWQTAANQDWTSTSGDPKFINPNGTSANVDLHIQPVTPTVVEQGGYNFPPNTQDFDLQNRSALTPVDIGADAGNFLLLDKTPPAISYTPLIYTCGTGDRTITGVNITDATGIPLAGALRPRIYYKKNAGAYFSQPGTNTGGTAFNSTWDFTIVAADMGGLVPTDVVSYYIIAQDNAAPINIASNAGGAVATDVNTVTIQPTTPNTYTINAASLAGTYTVGAAGVYPTLTAAVNAYNTACITGPVLFSLIDANYPSETFPISINANPYASSVNTLTIKPAAGVTATITGTTTVAPQGIIVLNGADWVTIDGSNGNVANTICPPSAASRDLTITNLSTSTVSAVIWLQAIVSTNPTNGVTNNTIRNLNLVGSGNTGTLFGIGMGSATTGITNASLGSGNNNNSFINNNISRTTYGIYTQGPNLSNKNTGNVINQNLINTPTPNNCRLGGIFTGFEDGIQVNGNNISELAATSDMFGIALGLASINTGIFIGNEVTNATCTNNKIGTVINTGTFAAAGITIANALTGTNTIANNMISGVFANGTAGDFAVGIFACGGPGSTTRIYHNSVSMSRSDLNTGTSPNYALAIGGVTPVVDVRNNILTSTGNNGTGANIAIGLAYPGTTGNYANLTSNFNNLYVTGTGSAVGVTGSLATGAGTLRTTLQDWQTETGRDGNSFNVVPNYTSGADLHLITTTNQCLDAGGTPIAGFTTDIDCQARNAITPDIGADEFTNPNLSLTASANNQCGGTPILLTATGGGTYAWSVGFTTASIVVVPVVNTTYTVTVTNGTCTDVMSIAITVLTAPSLTSVNTLPTSCVSSNGAIDLTVTPAGQPLNYDWADLAGASNPEDRTGLPPGFYNVTVTNTITGCTKTLSVDLTAGCQCPTIPNLSASPANAVCVGANFTLTSTNLTGMGNIYGITFKSFNAPTATPYVGGTVLATVTNANLTGGGTTATATVSIATPGNYNIYAILDQTPGDPLCRPSATFLPAYVVNALPTAATTVAETSGLANNDGIICAGASVTITATPAAGVTYSWTTGANTAAITVSPLITTIYTVTVSTPAGCTGTASRTITVNSLPTLFTVTGGGARCASDNVGFPIGLSGSQVGVNYQLFLNGNPLGAPVAGTGNAISFGPQLAVGTYTVVATNTTTGCSASMTGNAAVSTFNCTVAISDPCICLNNATTLFNGQFGEVIKVNAPGNQTWTVTAINGLYRDPNVAPPSAPLPIVLGTPLTNLGVAMNMFELKGRHVDAIGYTVTVSNGLGTFLTIGNTCEYPNPSITSDLSGPFCLFSNPVNLTGNPGDANIVSQGFTVNGVAATQFNPAQGPGQYLVVYTVNGGVPKASGPNDPGCTQSVSTFVNVIATPVNLVCNDLVYVSLDADCTADILPDDILEGTYGCYDDYIVELDNTFPFGNGPWVPGVVTTADIGKTYQVRVTHLVSGNKCWGNVKVEDKLSPALTCEDFTIPCNTPNLAPNYLKTVLGIAVAFPAYTDCQAVTLTWSDTETDMDCASGLTKTISRKWTAVDASGNSSTCIQTIGLRRPGVDDLKLPPNYDGFQAPGFNCTAAYPTPDWIESQGLQGYPYVFGRPEGCNINWAYTDVLIGVCDGTYKVVREWTLLNWCIGQVIHYDQVIKVSDDTAPAMTCPGNMTVSVDPFTCCGTIDLPDLIVEDNCSRVNNIGGMVTTFDEQTGQQTGMFPIGGTLQDFPGNNWWDRDTLAAFGYTTCLPIGTQTVTYIVEDDCGNTRSCTFKLKVEDQVPPVAACDQFTTVALTNNGEAEVYATTFDDGSYDNCCVKDFTASKGGGFGPIVTFNCNDVGDTLMVTFRVTDCNGNTNDCMILVEVQEKIKPACVPPAQVNVTCENFDPSLWAYGIPQVNDNCCLDDTKVYQGQDGLTHTPSYTLFDTVCNKGTITRTFRAFDCHGQSSQCTQRVIVTYEQDYFVKFPNDVIVTVCDGTGNYGEPTFFGEDCELLGVSFEDEVFTVVPDACFKIERSWTIINWCTYNPNLPCINVPNPNPNPIANASANLAGPTVSECGTLAPWAPTVVKINPTDPQTTNFCTFWEKNANCYKYKQIIKIIDGVAPTGTYVVPDCSNANWFTPNNSQLWNEMYWWNNGIGVHDLCEEPTDLCITGTDACSGSNINIEYLLFLDLDGDGTMETVVNSVNTGIAGLGWNNVFYNNLNTPNFSGGTPRNFDERPVPANQKYGFAIQETVSGNNKTACVRWNTQQSQNTFVAPELPHGTHKIKWFISDGCGNNKEYEYTFTVKDCKAPTVVCLNGLSVNIMPTGMIQLWASDFLQYTEDNCTPTAQLKIGIRKCGTGTGFPVDGNGNPITSVTFTCSELGTQCVELWSIDAAGNADYCETYIIVQDNLGNCPIGDHINVSGVLKTEMTDGVEEALVNINGTSTFTPPYSYFDLSDGGGAYQVMNNVPLDASFTIAPEKDDNPLNGVTTYDLVLISKHILGLEPFTSPYKMIAADANKSGSITTFDIVELRKLILGIYTNLPNNTSWRFVDKAFQFPNANNPFQSVFPEMVSVGNAMSSQLGKDFAGVKIGDVNNSAVANATMQAEERTTGTALFDIEDRNLRAGEVFEVTFKSAQALKGFQFTMLLHGLEVDGVRESDQVTAANFGLVFDDAATVSIDGAQEFTLRFRAMKSGKLSEMLGVSGSITRAEAYLPAVASLPAMAWQAGAKEGGVERLSVAFRFSGKTIAGLGFELYQNQPNPFVNKTFVGFFLPEAAEATLSVFDESGRVVYQQKGQFAKGENSISLDRALINTTGLLYYKLETATDSATKKMIQAK